MEKNKNKGKNNKKNRNFPKNIDKNENFNKDNFSKNNNTNHQKKQTNNSFDENNVQAEQNIKNVDNSNENDIVQNFADTTSGPVIIVGVRFDNSGKTNYFSPNGLKLKRGDKILAQSEQGLEVGTITFSNFEIDSSKLTSPLKNIIRKANEQDLEKLSKLKEKENKALKVCKDLIEQQNLEMKLVNATMLFDENKLIITFTSEGRIDFRELVKELASIFKTRIEMRQIGPRDEVRCSNCFGMCGQQCCCSRFLSDYEKTSIKMAKNQNLALNPQKISGICGRLLCCLGYENEHYVEALKQMPKVGSKIDTPDGEGVVTYNNLISKFVTAKIKIDDDNFELKQYELEEIKIYEKNIIDNKSQDDETLE